MPGFGNAPLRSLQRSVRRGPSPRAVTIGVVALALMAARVTSVAAADPPLTTTSPTAADPTVSEPASTAAPAPASAPAAADVGSTGAEDRGEPGSAGADPLAGAISGVRVVPALKTTIGDPAAARQTTTRVVEPGTTSPGTANVSVPLAPSANPTATVLPLPPSSTDHPLFAEQSRILSHRLAPQVPVAGQQPTAPDIGHGPRAPSAPPSRTIDAPNSATSSAGGETSVWCALLLSLAVLAAQELRRHRVRLVVRELDGFSTLPDRPG